MVSGAQTSDTTDDASSEGTLRDHGRMRRSERMAAILSSLTSSGSANVKMLAEQFGVSEATLRRDLTLLEDQRLITRTHGGALAQDLAFELPVRYRDARQKGAKQSIAFAAARRLDAGPEVVALTGGTTTSEVARQLALRQDLTIVTNALNIAVELVMRPRVKLVVVGGVSRPQSYELVGPWAEEVISSINIGTVFVGVDGITADEGLTTHDEVEARTNRAMIARSRRVIVVADSTKIGRVMLARIVGVDAVHEVVTDEGADRDEVARLRDAGIAVTIAPSVRTSR